MFKCKDCEYALCMTIRINYDDATCTHQAALVQSKDINYHLGETGGKVYFKSCKSMRADGGDCTPSAVHFKPKKTLWQWVKNLYPY